VILETQELIKRLAEEVTPVKPLPAPAIRAALWLAVSTSYVAVVVFAYRHLGDTILRSLDQRFVVEELALIATAITAAVAAFCCVVPGRDRRISFLPLVPLAIWLTSLAQACLNGWLQLGSVNLGLPPDWWYFPKFALIGLAPALAMILMMRRGAPLYPRSTLALGALAVAALGNVGLRFFHVGEVTVTVLICDLGTIALLSALAAWAGPRVLSWPYVVGRRETIAPTI
jgi:hypothetical protein